MKAGRKKILSLMLAGATAVSLMTACGGGNGGSAANEEITSAADLADKEDVTLKFYSWESNCSKEILDAANAYHEANPNITVEVEFLGDTNSTEYLKKIDLMIMGNEDMDVVMQPSLAQHSSRANGGALMSLNQFMDAEGIKMKEEYVIDTPVNGEYYGIPNQVKSWYVLINKNHLEEAGLDVPDFEWTWEDYKEYSVALTKGEGANKRYGSFMQAANDRYAYLPIWVEKDDNPYFLNENDLNFNDPLLKSFLEYRYDLENVTKSQVPYSDVKSLNMNYRDQFFNEKVSMLVIGSYTLADISNQEKYPHDFVSTFAPIPRWDESTEAGRTITEGHYYSIAKTSKHPQEAYDFIRWFTTDGMEYFKSSVSAASGVDRVESFLAGIYEEDEKYYDIDALNNLFNNELWKDNIYKIAPVYQSQLESMLKEEVEKYLLGQQDIDTTIEALNVKGKEIQEEAK